MKLFIFYSLTTPEAVFPVSNTLLLIAQDFYQHFHQQNGEIRRQDVDYVMHIKSLKEDSDVTEPSTNTHS